jgi:lysophospholipase L1-like esterase
MTHDLREWTLSRRTLVRGAALSGAGLTILQWLEQGAVAAEDALPKQGVILFQGDSITDAGRNRQATQPNDVGGLGRGYAFLIACRLLAEHAEQNLKIYNRGISGNKVPDLDQRWPQDCLDLQPALLSILIGVNDIWHKLNGAYQGSVADYEQQLLALLNRTRDALPQTRIVVCEPFVLRCGAVNERWFPEFDERRAACWRVAQQASCTVVPFQEMFDKATTEAPPAYWAADGVHPTLAGHALMAKTWIETVLS